MAKDDYSVIAYKLLSILYALLKQGKAITQGELDELGSGIDEEYWNFILVSLYEEGYVTGLKPTHTITGNSVKIINLKITVKEIQYLQDNSKWQKVKDYLSHTADWIELLAKFTH